MKFRNIVKRTIIQKVLIATRFGLSGLISSTRRVFVQITAFLKYGFTVPTLLSMSQGVGVRGLKEYHQIFTIGHIVIKQHLKWFIAGVPKSHVVLRTIDATVLQWRELCSLRAVCLFDVELSLQRSTEQLSCVIPDYTSRAYNLRSSSEMLSVGTMCDFKLGLDHSFEREVQKYCEAYYHTEGIDSDSFRPFRPHQ